MNNVGSAEAVDVASGVDRIRVVELLNAFEIVVVGNVLQDEKIVLSGFPSFERAERKARAARNPQTGEAMRVKSSVAPKISIGSSFKRSVIVGDRTIGGGPREAIDGKASGDPLKTDDGVINGGPRVD